jgi:hypothetical protein
LKERWREGQIRWGDEKEEVSNYRMIFRKKEDPGN